MLLEEAKINKNHKVPGSPPGLAIIEKMLEMVLSFPKVIFGLSYEIEIIRAGSFLNQKGIETILTSQAPLFLSIQLN